MRTLAVLPLLVALAVSCGNGDEDLTGSWTGTFDQVAQNRAGTIRLDLSQSGPSLAGRFQIEIPPGLRWGGDLQGSVAGSSLEVRLVPDDREICPYLWTASFGDDRIEGSYEAYDCRVEIVGRIDVRRR